MIDLLLQVFGINEGRDSDLVAHFRIQTGIRVSQRVQMCSGVILAEILKTAINLKHNKINLSGFWGNDFINLMDAGNIIAYFLYSTPIIPFRILILHTYLLVRIQLQLSCIPISNGISSPCSPLYLNFKLYSFRWIDDFEILRRWHVERTSFRNRFNPHPRRLSYFARFLFYIFEYFCFVIHFLLLKLSLNNIMDSVFFFLFV